MVSSNSYDNNICLPFSMGHTHYFYQKFSILFLVIICTLVFSNATTARSKDEFLRDRSDKGLLYFRNFTGNADYHKGGNSYDVTRVMLDDDVHDLDERYTVTDFSIPERVFEYSVGGDIVGNYSLDEFNNNTFLNKRLGLRACCSGYFNKRETGPVIQTRDVSDELKAKFLENAIIVDESDHRHLERKELDIGEWIGGTPSRTDGGLR